MEKLIVLLIIIVAAAIHSWIQRKQEEAEERELKGRPPQPPGDRPPPLPPQQREQRVGGWEEELRRLLQGEERRPPASPPVVRPKAPAAPPVMHPARPAAPRPFLAHSSIPVPEAGREMEVGLSVRPVFLDQASAAHERASSLQASVVQRMQETTSRITTHAPATTPVVRRFNNADRMRSLLRQKESQRTVILASVILGPPRGLEL